jgi:hypothetical protein
MGRKADPGLVTKVLNDLIQVGIIAKWSWLSESFAGFDASLQLV